jgi:uncharacterized membrane-anchored protein
MAINQETKESTMADNHSEELAVRQAVIHKFQQKLAQADLTNAQLEVALERAAAQVAERDQQIGELTRSLAELAPAEKPSKAAAEK